jgi:putative acetyltransferase
MICTLFNFDKMVRVIQKMDIRIGELKNKQVISLLQEHHAEMLLLSPPESVHALDLDALNTPEITFISLWFNNNLAGVGAIKELGSEHAEIKSMRTSKAHLRKGVAHILLDYIIMLAIHRGYQKLSLETGTMDDFLPAQKLYLKFGFEECQPFGSYTKDPYSMFMSKNLN